MGRILKCFEQSSTFTVREVQFPQGMSFDVSDNYSVDFLTERLNGDLGVVSIYERRFRLLHIHGCLSPAAVNASPARWW
jgi:hypothetical protein